MTKDSVWIEIPKDRIRKVRHDIARVLKRKSVTARGLARITGQLVSMSKAVIPAKLLLRNAYRLLKTGYNWSDILLVDQPTHNDLTWWFESLKAWNGRSIADSSCIETVQIVTDASAHGWGGIAVSSNIQAQGVWNTHMMHNSSNMREISAVLLCLQSFAPSLRGKRVQILMDNVSCAAYINFQGGMHADLSKIWSLAIRQNLTISAKWLAGKLNTMPDYLIRLDNKYNWTIHPNLFQYLDKIWGPHTVDRFACMNSAQCAKYNSLFLDFRGGCLFSNRLARGKQFHKRTLPSSLSYSKQTRSVSGLCHYHSSIVQSSPIFSETDQQINRCSYTASQSTHVLHTDVKHVTRTVKKPKMEDLCLESLWKERLLSRHWSLEAIKSYNCFLAPSSLHT